jgi:hypothetical protein
MRKNHPGYWWERAEKVRAQAQEMRDLEARRLMLGIARDYERLAEKFERVLRLQQT